MTATGIDNAPEQEHYEGPRHGTILPCHACGTLGKVVRRPMGGGKMSLTYEPIGLDTLERAVVESVIKWRRWELLDDGIIRAVDALLAARAAQEQGT